MAADKVPEMASPPLDLAALRPSLTANHHGYALVPRSMVVTVRDVDHACALLDGAGPSVSELDEPQRLAIARALANGELMLVSRPQAMRLDAPEPVPLLSSLTTAAHIRGDA